MVQIEWTEEAENLKIRLIKELQNFKGNISFHLSF